MNGDDFLPMRTAGIVLRHRTSWNMVVDQFRAHAIKPSIAYATEPPVGGVTSVQIISSDGIHVGADFRSDPDEVTFLRCVDMLLAEIRAIRVGAPTHSDYLIEHLDPSPDDATEG